MAEGGSKHVIICGQEEYFEWRCKVCEEKGLMKEAAAYCKNCDETFCTPCVQYHDRFNKAHKVLGEKVKVDWGKPELTQNTGIECSDHPDQTISMYCELHDDMCCSVCAVLKHSDSCKPRMSYIPEVAKGVRDGANFKTVVNDSSILISSFTRLVQERRDLLAKVNDSRQKCKGNIESFHSEMAKQLHKLKDDTLMEMNKKHDEVKKSLEEDIEKCAKARKELQDMNQQMNPTGSVNEPLLFFKMKNSQKSLVKYTEISQDICAKERPTFEFTKSLSLDKSIRSAESLGECFEVKQTLQKKANGTEKEACVICKGKFNKARVLDCGHKFCTNCIEKPLKLKQACPTCGRNAVLTGDQPEGTMTVTGGRLLCLAFCFPSGIQEELHPHPGKPYKGMECRAYLPDNEEGNILCEMVKIAFDRKLLFTIRAAEGAGKGDVVTWNGINLETDYMHVYILSSNQRSAYLNRVKAELAAKGITEKGVR